MVLFMEIILEYFSEKYIVIKCVKFWRGSRYC